MAASRPRVPQYKTATHRLPPAGLQPLIEPPGSLRALDDVRLRACVQATRADQLLRSNRMACCTGCRKRGSGGAPAVRDAVRALCGSTGRLFSDRFIFTHLLDLE